MAALNLAGSVAGSQRIAGDTDNAKESASARSRQIDQQSREGAALEDVSDAEFSSDRDPDGRQHYQQSLSEEQDPRNDDPHDRSFHSGFRGLDRDPHRAADAFGERGNSLDLEA
jgi:hypothetical protein